VVRSSRFLKQKASLGKFIGAVVSDVTMCSRRSQFLEFGSNTHINTRRHPSQRVSFSHHSQIFTTGRVQCTSIKYKHHSYYLQYCSLKPSFPSLHNHIHTLNCYFPLDTMISSFLTAPRRQYVLCAFLLSAFSTNKFNADAFTPQRVKAAAAASSSFRVGEYSNELCRRSNSCRRESEEKTELSEID
jgi:hypothetical protein